MSTTVSTNSDVHTISAEPFSPGHPTTKNRNPRCKARTLSDAELHRLAASLATTTRRAVREVIRTLGVAPSDAQIDEVLEYHERQLSVRRCRVLLKANKRLTGSLPDLPAPTGRRPVRLPLGTLRERLTAARVGALKTTAFGLFRHGAAGGNSFAVSFVPSSQGVSYDVMLGMNWDTYRGSFKGWRAIEDHHKVSVPEDWRQRVLRRGLAQLGGMMTLDAHPLDAPPGIALYAAVWASQSRGYEVRTHRGFIAVCGDESFHADTPEAAVKGVGRKARRLLGERPTPYTMTVEAFVSRYRKHDCEVDLDDARETGSCEFGIRSWCEAVGLDYAAGQARLQEVLDAFVARPQLEVRRAVVHAVRRHRAAQRKTQ